MSAVRVKLKRAEIQERFPWWFRVHKDGDVSVSSLPEGTSVEQFKREIENTFKPLHVKFHTPTTRHVLVVFSIWKF